MSRDEAGDPAVFSIPPHRSFVDALAAGLIAKHGHDPMSLARGAVLVPTNRAARSLRDAFVRAAGEGTLLPRLVPIGDPELGDRLGTALDPLDGDPVPPAIDPEERLFLLASILSRGREEGTVAALKEAADLARTLDQLTVEQVSPRELLALRQESQQLEAHWQRLFEKLGLIVDAWPELLAERGRIDLAERRNRLLGALSDRWKASPPTGYVVAAGITTTAPAVAILLGTIARLPDGMIVLPALARERDMPEEEWAALKPKDREDGVSVPSTTMLAHPQYHLRLLLDRMKVGRGEVREWHRRGEAASAPERSRAVTNALAAARFTDKWQQLEAIDRRLGQGVKAAIFPDPASEAMGIAIRLREVLETPGKTAALVTPDRMLARRVSAILKRWKVDADDSAGDPLEQTTPAILLQHLMSLAEEDVSPITLLSLLKHPLVGGDGPARGDWLRDVRRLDLALRGPRPPAGLDGIETMLRSDADREAWGRLRPPVEQAIDLLRGARSISEIAGALREAGHVLAGDRLWQGAAGRELSVWIERIENTAGSDQLVLAKNEQLAGIRALMSGARVRPPYQGHPRIQILGLLEARLLQSDVMILGGLNEGVWPADSGTDPWLAPRLRRILGLPGLDYRIGLAGHDFMSTLGAPEVLLTRAVRDRSAPTIASRFLLRLEAMSAGLPRDDELVELAQAIDRPGTHEPVKRPMPLVPAEHRPRKLPVTAVEKLRADPYAFYAQRILGLRALDPVESRQIAAWQGNRVHDLFDEWFKQDGPDPDTIMPRLERMLADDAIHPMLRALWGPRLREGAEYVAQQIAADIAANRVPAATELKGEAVLHGVTLYGIADRIDRCANGSPAIIDYKTGGSPKRDALKAGFALQLGLLGLIAEAGGFETGQGTPAALEYWKLAKERGTFGSRLAANEGDVQDYLAETDAHLKRLVADYLAGYEPFTAKLNPAYAPYRDYDQLMRLEEWYGRGA
ncbi:double-strand break repair protein AddB [Sphingomicrobium sediminis]|uniref:Double-strand break repair protein AddB n=1 Tax=Sphingomicrobium sediminis TaxID=2950949 RepID=A0A9X2EG33_9SPHN|nr:double-strand break repair protein AddB [Sphingomicrobium sediminis]MCM8556880.1 double-strand break repair protein AddB [Sphingomicrobium sediminis]